jgi:hypothetical protein
VAEEKRKSSVVVSRVILIQEEAKSTAKGSKNKWLELHARTLNGERMLHKNVVGCALSLSCYLYSFCSLYKLVKLAFSGGREILQGAAEFLLASEAFNLNRMSAPRRQQHFCRRHDSSMRKANPQDSCAYQWLEEACRVRISSTLLLSSSLKMCEVFSLSC